MRHRITYLRITNYNGFITRSKDNKKLALDRMQQAGAIITNTESIVFEWLKDAKHAQFKAISALIR